VRGLSMCLPVLGESYRKQADQLSAFVSDQEETFAKGVATLEEAIALMEREGVTASDRRCEAYQRLGCIYRSWGVALLRRQRYDQNKAQEYFTRAAAWLEQALEVAEQDQPPVIVMDIYQDLAVTLVIQDRFDERVDRYLEKAEALAPREYHIEPGIGLRDIQQPIRAFWRILGQCELQRMMVGFGKFDYGERRQGSDGKVYVEVSGDVRFLKDAAHHLVLSLAYLMKYAYESAILDQARGLALGELRRGHSEELLKLMGQQAYETARAYRLSSGQELKEASNLLLRAQQDIDLPLELIQLR
jgi:tetratricopeptide (TPR) repeat protein